MNVRGLFVSILFSALLAVAGAEEFVSISSIDELKSFAGQNNVKVKMEPGIYRLIFCINDTPQAHKGFYVHEDPDEPLPHVSSIEIEEGDASWFATVGLLLLPGQAVSDCGVVRQADNEFHVNITVDWVDFPEPDWPTMA